MLFEDSLDFVGVYPPNVNAPISGSYRNVLTIGAESRSGPIAAHFKTISAEKKILCSVLRPRTRHWRPDVIRNKLYIDFPIKE